MIALLLSASLGLAGAFCASLDGCENGDWKSSWSWECVCDEGWEGACCDKTACQEVQTVADVDLDEWARATWYVQEQQVVDFQPAMSLYCVAATYEKDPHATVPGFEGEVLSVHNYANIGAVNGLPTNPLNVTLCARLADAAAPGKLKVAPCFLPNLAAGPYWIIAVGKNPEDKYDWAVVIGGKPTEHYPDGCTTKTRGTYGAGLWLLSRVPVASAATIQSMRDALAAQGVSTSQLRKVEQANCTYAGATIKP